MSQAQFSDLIGKTLSSIEGAEAGSDRITFVTSDGQRFAMFHNQDCCECVDVESVVGEVADLIGAPILMAEEATSDTNPEGVTVECQDSFTWTFYKLATVKGYVDIRWYGSSNGYYGEGVSFFQQAE
jgi:hypothetical protein